MVSTAKRNGVQHPFWVGVLVWANLIEGCSIVYPELSTPVRSVPTGTEVSPEPPSDIVQLAITSARIPPRTRDGRSWDNAAGSAPDVYAILFIDQVEVARTEVVSDSFRPKWPNDKPVNYEISPSTEVRVELWDDNVLVAHPICSQVLGDVTSSMSVGLLEINCESGAALELTVLPAKARLGLGLFYEKRGKEAFVTRVVTASAAGRARIRATDQIVKVRNRSVSELTSGELESMLNANSKGSIELEIRDKAGDTRRIELREEAMYPVYGEDVEL